MEPLIDHIEITVGDMATAVPFYDRFLPLLGFDLARRSEAVIAAHEKHVVSYEHPRMSFAITSPLRAFAGEAINRRKPGALHHLAFRAASRAEVDRLHLELKAIGATIVSPPREYPEYTPAGYYALYFKDPEGIKYEIVCTDDSGAAASDGPSSGEQSVNVIQEPIILDGDGGADVFRTKEEAERYTEPIDIENGEYVAYDAAGRLLDLSVSPDGFRGQLTLPHSPEDRSAELAEALRTMLRNIAAVRCVPFDSARLNDYSLEQLVRISMNYYTR
jgi:catechol 2,3-dioxygenase-like lactoylglutathione lyase family enzyme